MKYRTITIIRNIKLKKLVILIAASLLLYYIFLNKKNTIIHDKYIYNINETHSTKIEVQETVNWPENTENFIRNFMNEYSQKCEKHIRVHQLRKYLNICECVPKIIKKRLLTNYSNIPSWLEIEHRYENHLQNGESLPTTCFPIQTIALIIPFRDREDHLKLFLNHMHGILQAQQIHYKIFIVEQNYPTIFNKASLMNIGFLEALKQYKFECVIFHDVDLLAEDGRNIYNCYNSPRHIGSHVDKYGYDVFYGGLVGGSIAFTTEQFKMINGYSTMFYGWGGEDDDIRNRMSHNNLRVSRFPAEIARYTMIKHSDDKRNPFNKFRHMSLDVRPSVYENNGLNSLHYNVIKQEKQILFTKFLVDLSISENNDFVKIIGSCYNETHASYNKKGDVAEDCAIICLRNERCIGYQFIEKTCYIFVNYCQDLNIIYANSIFYQKKKNITDVENLFIKYSGECKESSFGYQQLPLHDCARLCYNDMNCLSFSYNFNVDSNFPCHRKNKKCTNETLINNSHFNTFIRKNASVFVENEFNQYLIKLGDCNYNDILTLEYPVDYCAVQCSKNKKCYAFVVFNGKCFLKSSCVKTEPKLNAYIYLKLNRK